ncbi:MAG: NAD-dependent epimerase/dehydratase family protein [Bacteroidota bacterium]|nr:NAD-dependent epimerase/dehydratase family protein [Bacteroidota bacterium]MDP4212611.1 NAD-dependent epimerase/dehydratase family protein [Bacteroidota bacterium]
MEEHKTLVIGASGQIGTELTLALRHRYGGESVIAADLKREADLLKGAGPFLPLDVMDKMTLQVQVRRNNIKTIYLLAAMLSASGEQQPQLAWKLNMESLLNTLEVAREEGVQKVFWPSSIAVFGPDAPRVDCPQNAWSTPATVYGISKLSGEQWCHYYFKRYGVDIRSIRYPGLISYKTLPGGGTTDYAIEIYHAAVRGEKYTCFLKEDARLPMMYMDDAVRGTIELMEAPASRITVRTAYNLAGISFTPAEIAAEIKQLVPGFSIDYKPDYRQAIAETWPESINDQTARSDWGWKPEYGLRRMSEEMLRNIRPELAMTTKHG